MAKQKRIARQMRERVAESIAATTGHSSEVAKAARVWLATDNRTTRDRLGGLIDSLPEDQRIRCHAAVRGGSWALDELTRRQDELAEKMNALASQVDAGKADPDAYWRIQAERAELRRWARETCGVELPEEA